MIPDIVKELEVQASQETCFQVFTEKIDLWWPRDYHVGKTAPTEFILEPGPDGRWYSRHEDGSEITIGHVLTWKPYDLLILNWQLGGDFQFHPEILTQVELQFIPLTKGSTLVKFAHRNLNRLSGGDKNILDMNTGWGYIMSLYKQYAEITKISKI